MIIIIISNFKMIEVRILFVSETLIFFSLVTCVKSVGIVLYKYNVLNFLNQGIRVSGFLIIALLSNCR